MSELFQFRFAAMGTNCSLHLYASDRRQAELVARRGIEEVERIEARYSRYRSDSDLSQINRAAAQGGSLDVDEETAGLLNYAYAAFERSDGLFDITSGTVGISIRCSVPRVCTLCLRLRSLHRDFDRPGHVAAIAKSRGFIVDYGVALKTD